MTKNDRRWNAWRTRYRRGPLVAGAVLAVLTATIAPAVQAQAAVPTFPDNIIVFPGRDFVSVEGYEDRVGQTATLDVTRAGVGVVGSAQAVVKTGGVAFEVNHPGGVCWGAGTNLKVTPDIVPGDVVTIRFGSTAVGDTRVGDAFVTSDAVANGATVTVDGHIGATVDKANLEQRIVEPALVDLVGKRDVRAIPGPLTPAPRGGYSSSLEYPTPTTFRATYQFLDPDGAGPKTAADVAQVAADAALGERALSWELVDADGNRQGLTIAEFGEPGGPAMGGCPNGPLASGPVGPTDVTAAVVNGTIKVNWTPAVAVAGTQPITGYRVRAVAQTVSGTGEQIELGRRINRQAANSTTITGISPSETYDVEVASVSSVGETYPPISARAVVDTTPPTVSVSPSAGTFATPPLVTLGVNESGSQIFYTLDGSDPLDSAGDATPGAIHYVDPFRITNSATLKVVAFDPSNNASDVLTRAYVVTNTPVPDPPTFGPSSVGNGSVTLSWTGGDSSVTGYGVQLYNGAGATVGALRETTATTLTITGLTPDTPYFATVKAKNANGYGAESAKTGPLTPTGDVVANAGPDQTVARRTTPTTVTLTGAGSTTAGATYLWTQVTTGANDPDAVTLSGATTLSPTFSLPLYAYPMTNNALTFRLKVTTAAGSRTDDVLVKPTPSRATISSAKWKAGDFRVIGTDSLVGTTITLHQGSLAGPVLSRITTTAAAPPGIADYTIRLRTGPGTTTNPGTVWVESTGGGTAGPFTVTNG